MAFCWRADDGSLVGLHVHLDPPSPNQLKQKKNVVKVGLPLTKLPGFAHVKSGRVVDSRPRGRGFEPHRRHYVVVLYPS